MNKPTFKAYTNIEDELLLLAKVFDKAAQSETKNIITHSDFLSDREQSLAMQMLDNEKIRYFRYGGYAEADRAVLFFLPQYIDENDFDTLNNMFCYIRIIPDELAVKFKKNAKLSHRDFLGSILGTGIERCKLGDLIVYDNRCDAVLSPACGKFLSENLSSVGHFGVVCKEISPNELAGAKQEFLTKNDSVSSLRLDCILASAYNLSRSNAEKLIESGSVSVNHRIVIDTDKKLAEGDIVSAKTFGKFVFEKLGGNSKKGRIFVDLKIYK